MPDERDAGGGASAPEGRAAHQHLSGLCVPSRFCRIWAPMKTFSFLDFPCCASVGDVTFHQSSLKKCYVWGEIYQPGQRRAPPLVMGRTRSQTQSESIECMRDDWIRIALAAAAAKSLPSCPTLCNPTDGSPPGSTIPGILQARTLEWAAISSSNAGKWKVKVKSLSKCPTLRDPMDY